MELVGRGVGVGEIAVSADVISWVGLRSVVDVGAGVSVVNSSEQAAIKRTKISSIYAGICFIDLTSTTA